jgi:hypothetical protein
MEEEVQKYLYNPTVGKLVTLLGYYNLDVNKATKKNLFSKIKDNDNRYKAKKSAASLVILRQLYFFSYFCENWEA